MRPVAQGVQVLGRGHLEVVGALQRQVDLGGAGEALAPSTVACSQRNGLLGGRPSARVGRTGRAARRPPRRSRPVAAARCAPGSAARWRGSGSSPALGDADAAPSGSVSPRTAPARRPATVNVTSGQGRGHGSCTTLRCATPAKNPSMKSRACCAAVEAAPQQPQTADELVAGVDGHQDEPGPAASDRHRRRARAPAEPRCRRRAGPPADRQLAAVPGRQVQLGLGGAGRSGVERDGAVQGRVAEEERQPDRDLQRLPLPPVRAAKSGNDR